MTKQNHIKDMLQGLIQNIQPEYSYDLAKELKILVEHDMFYQRHNEETRQMSEDLLEVLKDYLEHPQDNSLNAVLMEWWQNH